jgi:hypothetical protein
MMARWVDGDTVPLVTMPTCLLSESTSAAPWRMGIGSSPIRPTSLRVVPSRA